MTEQPPEQTPQQPELPAKPKRKKTGGRQKGTKNKRTVVSLERAKRELYEAQARGKKLSVEHMDDMIEFLRNLVGLLSPWAPDGSHNGKDRQLWFQALAAFKGFLEMRAPYQSPRLGAIAFMHDRMKEVSAEVSRSRLLDDLRMRGIVIEHGLLIDRSDKVIDANSG